MRSVSAKSMYDVGKDMSFTRDSTQYGGAGGKLTHSSESQPNK